MSYYDPLSGYNNQGGYSQYKGENKRNPYKGPQYKQDDVDIVQIEWINGMTPENIWDMKRTQPDIPTQILKSENCEDIGLNSDMMKEAQRWSTQQGFKKAGKSESALLGFRDFTFPSDCSKGRVSHLPTSVDSEEPAEGSGIIDYKVVNSESAKFRYGRQDMPPQLGQNLPGSMQVLQQGNQGGEIIWKEKARMNPRGAGSAGYYAGYQSIRWSDNGMLNQGTNV